MNARRISRDSFPLTAKYDPEWVRANALGENALCQAEILARHIPLRAGMRVLDLGCGKATSSIFLAREFGVEVWAVDELISPTENRGRAAALECERSVFPLQLDARKLPFAADFFDVVTAIDSFLYFGTDERFLEYLTPFVKRSGYIGLVDIAFTRPLQSSEDAPGYLREDYGKYWSYVHDVPWWVQHWEKTGLVEVLHAEHLAESDALLRDYANERPQGHADDAIMRASRSDDEGLLSLFCMIGRRR